MPPTETPAFHTGIRNVSNLSQCGAKDITLNKAGSPKMFFNDDLELKRGANLILWLALWATPFLTKLYLRYNETSVPVYIKPERERQDIKTMEKI